MATTTSSSSSSEAAAAAPKAKIYDVVEFASLRPNDKMVSVGRYRTIYLPNGRINRQYLPVTEMLRELVSAFDGYSLESEEALTGFFADSQVAADCARAIEEHHRRSVDVRGNQIVIAL